MASSKFDFITLKGQDYFLTKGIMKVYILQKYIDSSASVEKKASIISKIEGNVVSSLGLLPFRWYATIKDADADKPSLIGTLNIPSLINFYPQDVDTDKSMLIYKESYLKDYTIMTLADGYKCFQGNIVKKLTNVTLFFEDLFLNGRLDDNIPYNLLTPACIRNMELNDVSLQMPAFPFGTIVNRMCRNPNNLKETFAKYIARQKNPSMIGYRFVNVREMSASSVFGGISFEDFNYMVDLGLTSTAENRKQSISPLEDIIKL